MIEILFVVLLGILSYSITFIITPLIQKLSLRARIIGIDTHKLSKPTIPTMGGISIIFSITISMLLSAFLLPEFSNFFFALFFSTLIVGLIGVLDDIYKIHPFLRPILTALACIPFIWFEAYSSRPVLPFIGRTRLTLVYPLLIPIAFAVASNVTDMIDVLNGSMVGMSMFVIIALLISSFIFQRLEAIVPCLVLLGSLLAFYHYNKYPARIFPGSSGGLTVGAFIAGISIVGKIEAIGVIALLPQIMNAFYVLTSVKKLSRYKLWPRPIKLLNDERLIANEDLDAPITLVRMIVVKEPLKEQEIIKKLFYLSSFSCFLAILTVLTIL